MSFDISFLCFVYTTRPLPASRRGAVGFIRSSASQAFLDEFYSRCRVR